MNTPRSSRKPQRSRASYRTSPGRGSETGVALTIVIIALLVVTAIAAGMIILSNSETNIDANYRDEQVALFAAQAGLEEARDRMLTSNPSPVVPPVTLPGTTDSVAYITASGVSPWSTTSKVYNTSVYDSEYVSTELGAAGLTTGTGWYTDYATNTNYSGLSANPVPYQWVRINLKLDGTAAPYLVDGNSANKTKQVCYDTVNLHETVISAASCSTASPNYEPVYEITSFAVTPSGTQRMLQQEVTKDLLNLTLPGALTIDGPSLAASTICASGSTCNGSGAYISGDEPSSCPSGGTVPAIATADATSASDLAAGVKPNETNIVGSGGTPSVVNSSSALANLTTVAEVQQLVSQMESLAGSNTCTSSCSSLNLGTSTSPTIAVVDNATSGSAFQLNSGTTGYGILVVTGTLDYVNVNSYQGIILMLGTGQFISSSSKDTTLTGALFIAQDRNPSTGALLAGPALGTTPVFNYHHGNASSTDPSIQFNQCVINQVESTAVNNYRVLSQRELMF
jgi:Tfp pilus assembly protein PilX